MKIKSLAYLTLPLIALSACNQTSQKAISSASEVRTASEEVKYSENDIYIGEKGNQIYGKLYRPAISGKQPIVIYSHGLGGDHKILENFAQALAKKGVLGLAIDYRGGGKTSKSDGKTTDMSVLTEIRDLEEVIAAVKKWDFVDANKIVLMGESQGGAVSSLTAAKHPNDIAGLIAFYPAFVIQDDAHKNFPTAAQIKDFPNYFNTIDLGAVYFKDAYNLNVYDKIGAYNKPMLLVHGSEDPIVPIKYSEQASKVFPKADFHTIENALHSFAAPEYFPQALKLAEEYLRKQGFMK